MHLEVTPCQPPQKSAPPFAACTRADASSFPIPGTSAPRAICRAWASRRWPPRAPASPGRAGFADGGVPRDMMLAHIAELSAAADVPMNADFEGGYADEPEGVAESVRLCVATGVSGLSIEDYTGDMDKPLYDFDLAVARMRRRARPSTRPAATCCSPAAARASSADRAGPRRDDPPPQGLRRRRRRLPLCARHQDARADRGGGQGRGAEAGQRADGRRRASSRCATSPTLGVRRISVGGALARAAWGGFMRTAKEIAEPRQLQGLRRCRARRRHRQGLARLTAGSDPERANLSPAADGAGGSDPMATPHSCHARVCAGEGLSIGSRGPRLQADLVQTPRERPCSSTS